MHIDVPYTKVFRDRDFYTIRPLPTLSAMSFDPKRRNFMKAGLGVGIGIIGTEIGCGPSSKQVEFPNTCASKPPTDEEMAQGAIQKGPYIQFLDATTARLRFETRIDETTSVQIERDGEVTVRTPDRVAETLDYQSVIDWAPRPDRAGPHVLHTLLIHDLSPSETVSYAVMQGFGDPVCGSFRAPPPSGHAFRLGWIADTMSPLTDNVMRRLASESPDLVLHGGDIVYDTNPIDTWNDFFAVLQPVSLAAPIHFNVGNHEYESMNEIVVQYDRLFEGQGAASHIDDAGNDTSIDSYGRPKRYHSFSYGGVRFICLDTESRIPEPEDYVNGELIEEGSDGDRELYAEDSEQMAWLQRQLDQAKNDAKVQHIVVSFHRPMFTFSKYGLLGDSAIRRDALHQRFVDAGVSIVICGHAHCFEFFEVDDIPYVIDGGGGALLVDPNDRKDEVLAERPEEEAYRLHVERTYGLTTIDFEANGAFTIRRFEDKENHAPQFEKHYSAG